MHIHGESAWFALYGLRLHNGESDGGHVGRVRPSLPTPDAGELHHSTSVRREQGNVHQATPGPDPSGTRHDDAGACATPASNARSR